MEPVEGSIVTQLTPEPVLRGTFAVYVLPDGGRLIAYRPDGEEESQHIPIPAVLMRMWERQNAGEQISPMQAFKAMFG